MFREFYYSAVPRTRTFAWVATVLLVAAALTRAVLNSMIVAWMGSFYDLLQVQP